MLLSFKYDCCDDIVMIWSHIKVNTVSIGNTLLKASRYHTNKPLNGPIDNTKYFNDPAIIQWRDIKTYQYWINDLIPSIRNLRAVCKIWICSMTLPLNDKSQHQQIRNINKKNQKRTSIKYSTIHQPTTIPFQYLSLYSSSSLITNTKK